MKHVPPYVRPEIADRVIASDDEVMRLRGANIVALQLNQSAVFSRFARILAVIACSLALWLHSWLPVIVTALVLVALYYRLIVSASHFVTRSGTLPEYQIAYKRLYYKDVAFKRQVDDLRARNK